jgi:hypothetical protein
LNFLANRFVFFRKFVNKCSLLSDLGLYLLSIGFRIIRHELVLLLELFELLLHSLPLLCHIQIKITIMVWILQVSPSHESKSSCYPEVIAKCMCNLYIRLRGVRLGVP